MNNHPQHQPSEINEQFPVVIGTEKPKRNLSLLPLTFIVIGSMIGSEMFNLPKNMSQNSGALGIIIAWIITGLGMMSVGLTFKSLSNKLPQVEGSVYGYARKLGGDYLAFNSAFGYWISAIFGNVGFLIMMFAALGYFFPIFGEGTSITSIIAASIVVWLIHLLVLNGVTGATIFNSIVTIAKIVPLIFFIIVVILLFDHRIFKLNFAPDNIAPLFTQIKNNMLVAVFVFIGIEGASIYSSRAKKQQDVGKATILGFLIVISLLMMVSVLSLGVIPRNEILQIPNPSTAGVLSVGVGFLGVIIINVGIIVSVLGCVLAWVLLTTEMPYFAAQDNIFPKLFGRLNNKNTPTVSLFGTSMVTQIFLIISYFSNQAYYLAITLCSSMVLIPYVFTSFYLLKEILTKKTLPIEKFTKKDLFIAVFSAVFIIWVIYAQGLNYVLMSMILYGLGIIIYIWAKVAAKKRIFSSWAETALAGLIILLLILAVINIKYLANF